MKEEHCVNKAEKPAFKHILEGKIKALEDEIKDEEEFYKENGLYNERDPADIMDEIQVAKRVLKTLDEVPDCKPHAHAS